MKPEPRVQRRFSILEVAAALTMVVTVLAAHRIILELPDREPLAPAVTELRFEPVAFDQAEFAPLRLAGAWEVSGDDPRVGGISALAVDGSDLIALTDSGAVIRFAKPAGGRAEAQVRDLPEGPGDERYKEDRDSEAIARDPGGRGWWVAFENRNQLWLYDPAFERALGRIAIPEAGLVWNSGIEGLASAGRELLLLPESGGRLLRLGASGWSELPFAFPARRASGAASLSEDSILVIERRLGIFGLANTLLRLDRCRSGYCLAWRKPLPVGGFDNVEAIAAEPLPSGDTRLWLMTDDNSNRPLRTVLIAADLPPQH